MVVRDIILVVAVLGVMVFGFFVMKRLDKFLDENRKGKRAVLRYAYHRYDG